MLGVSFHPNNTLGSLRRSVIALLRADFDVGKAKRGIHFQSNVAPAAVLSRVRRSITDDVFVLQFDGDRLVSLIQTHERPRRTMEGVAARNVDDIVDGALGSDGKNLYVLLSGKILQI